MVKQNISIERKFPVSNAGSTWKENCVSTPAYRAKALAPERKVFVTKKGPTFLNVYAIPVLLLNLALLGWDVISANIAQGWSIYLGYAVIVTVSLYLYLAYLDRRYFN